MFTCRRRSSRGQHRTMAPSRCIDLLFTFLQLNPLPNSSAFDRVPSHWFCERVLEVLSGTSSADAQNIPTLGSLSELRRRHGDDVVHAAAILLVNLLPLTNLPPAPALRARLVQYSALDTQFLYGCGRLGCARHPEQTAARDHASLLASLQLPLDPPRASRGAPLRIPPPFSLASAVARFRVDEPAVYSHVTTLTLSFHSLSHRSAPPPLPCATSIAATLSYIIMNRSAPQPPQYYSPAVTNALHAALMSLLEREPQCGERSDVLRTGSQPHQPEPVAPDHLSRARTLALAVLRCAYPLSVSGVLVLRTPSDAFRGCSRHAQDTAPPPLEGSLQGKVWVDSRTGSARSLEVGLCPLEVGLRTALKQLEVSEDALIGIAKAVPWSSDEVWSFLEPLRDAILKSPTDGGGVAGSWRAACSLPAGSSRQGRRHAPRAAISPPLWMGSTRPGGGPTQVLNCAVGFDTVEPPLKRSPRLCAGSPCVSEVTVAESDAALSRLLQFMVAYGPLVEEWADAVGRVSDALSDALLAARDLLMDAASRTRDEVADGGSVDAYDLSAEQRRAVPSATVDGPTSVLVSSCADAIAAAEAVVEGAGAAPLLTSNSHAPGDPVVGPPPPPSEDGESEGDGSGGSAGAGESPDPNPSVGWARAAVLLGGTDGIGLAILAMLLRNPPKQGGDDKDHVADGLTFGSSCGVAGLQCLCRPFTHIFVVGRNFTAVEGMLRMSGAYSSPPSLRTSGIHPAGSLPSEWLQDPIQAAGLTTRIILVHADLSRAEEAAECMRRAFTLHSFDEPSAADERCVDLCVASSGTYITGPALNESIHDTVEHTAVNVSGLISACRTILRVMPSCPRKLTCPCGAVTSVPFAPLFALVNSTLAAPPFRPTFAIQSATKAASLTWARVLREELPGMRVTTILPCSLDTQVFAKGGDGRPTNHYPPPGRVAEVIKSLLLLNSDIMIEEVILRRVK